MKPRDCSVSERRGFTLVELLAAVAVGLLLAAIAVPVIGSSLRGVRTAECLGTLRSLGAAVRLFAQDHHDNFPRSFHSAAAHREPGWAASLVPYLDTIEPRTPAQWREVFNRYFRCPAHDATDPMHYSYGLNVYFELDPNGDDYPGHPATWRKSVLVPRPAETILLGEIRTTGTDHFMCHMWSSANAARNTIAHERHGGKSNYLFVDGHVATLALEETFAPREGRNRWHPGE